MPTGVTNGGSVAMIARAWAARHEARRLLHEDEAEGIGPRLDAEARVRALVIPQILTRTTAGISLTCPPG